jgi:hypothetical protein
MKGYYPSAIASISIFEGDIDTGITAGSCSQGDTDRMRRKITGVVSIRLDVTYLSRPLSESRRQRGGGVKGKEERSKEQQCFHNICCSAPVLLSCSAHTAGQGRAVPCGAIM